MMQTKAIKKRTRNKQTLLNNLRKGKARKEPRCAFGNIPRPTKFNLQSEVYHLQGNIVLVETNGTIGTEPSLLNRLMVFKNTQIVDMYKDRAIRVMIEMKDVEFTDWKWLVDRLHSSENAEKQEWARLIKGYCERYESVVKAVTEDCGGPSSMVSLLQEVNKKTEALRQTLFTNYPFMELKSKVIDGQIKLTEIVYSNRMMQEVGHKIENFASTVVQEGLPKVTPFDDEVCVKIAKHRLENYISLSKDGVQTPEIEMSLHLKNGFVKRVKCVWHFQTTYEKGVVGFSVLVIISAKKTPYLEPEVLAENQVNKDFVEVMANKEKQMEDFLATYYNHAPEKRYTNFDKICKVKELKDE